MFIHDSQFHLHIDGNMFVSWFFPSFRFVLNASHDVQYENIGKSAQTALDHKTEMLMLYQAGETEKASAFLNCAGSHVHWLEHHLYFSVLHRSFLQNFCISNISCRSMNLHMAALHMLRAICTFTLQAQSHLYIHITSPEPSVHSLLVILLLLRSHNY